MFRYRNENNRKVIFRAGASAEEPSKKKFYEVEAGKEIELPVKLNEGAVPNLVLIEEEKVKKKRREQE